MLRSRLVSTGIALLFVITPAIAQSPGQGSVRVQSTINFFVAGPSGDSEEAQKLRDRARRTVYEMAARECDLLREVLARDCRRESVNTNINRQFGSQQPEGFSVSGSMGFQITLK
ncbi:hypothetical protein QA641_18380 [Bradyrhizobium sp. CB1650]|uniref:hypothetical protein n=1 Tax=Bradyrhizobium sp. CB1650 TaxID=3039153 RepID=UPI002435815C|nr:hypothetical protein [Bradyrhizobium sp. CB1650]WGD55670.1 hypothetical protein QA641_18380 [Bradyrhizobium sp. CB1650]